MSARNRRIHKVKRHSNRISSEILGEILDPSGLRIQITRKTSSPWHQELSITMEQIGLEATPLGAKREVALLSYHGTVALADSLKENLLEIEDMIARYEGGEPRMVRGENRLNLLQDSRIETYFGKHPMAILKSSDANGTIEYYLRINYKRGPVKYLIYDFKTTLSNVIQVLEDSL